jgi:hypothetical protein
VGFDLGFIEAALGDGTRIESGRYLDTLTIAREGYPDLENYKLPTLSHFFGIELAQAHRALPDAEATASLLLFFGNDLPGRIAGLRQASRRPSAPPATVVTARRSRGCAPRGSRLEGPVQPRPQEDRAQGRARRGIRLDGRGLTELRPISVEVGLLPRAHGSGLFTRGETQVLTIATLGSSSDVQRIDTISPQTEKRYIHHYNFPPYSTGENKPMRGPRGATSATVTWPSARSSRCCRAARTSLRHPARVRVHVVQRLDVDGVDLRLDARPDGRRRADHGPVAGAAMGLISEPDGRFVVLTDILGKEDSVGDMDFKVTGTRDGVTALQMDIKVKGINEAIIREGLKQALAARLEILDKMTAVMPRPAGDERLRAAHHHDQDQPRQDPRDHRQGGSMIRKIQERPRPRSTSRTTDGRDRRGLRRERPQGDHWIESLTREVEIGALYLARSPGSWASAPSSRSCRARKASSDR